MRRDHRPWWMKRAYLGFQQFYTRRFLAPHLESIGEGFTFMKPWHVEVFGGPVRLGRFATVIATPDMKVRLSVWSEDERKGSITIGDYCMLCPGVRIGSGDAITIGDNAMVASGAYITDGDWHDLYNRNEIGRSAPVAIGENVWIGDSAIVCKGVTIGENSIVGAGAVVVDDIPPHTVAAGNPARPVKQLDPDRTFVKRKEWFSAHMQQPEEIERYDRYLLRENSFSHWLRYILGPKRGD